MKPVALRKGLDVERFGVDLEVANYYDLEQFRQELLPADQVRRETIKGLVDSGATKLVLPAALVKRLGFRLTGKVRVRYADGRTKERQEAGAVYVKLLGRHGCFDAIVEPQRKDALIGAIVLEALDLLVDCQNQCLVPRDANGAIFEIG